MDTHILIPTDGSELAGKAVQHGSTLAKLIGAKVTVLTVLPPPMITSDRGMDETILSPSPSKRQTSHADYRYRRYKRRCRG